ncbi:hypothetical protein NHL50_14700 [Acidimicrobiia bacterium EGI L10123]|uniref:hypothetical protein n=1 Tax=Salinilacustrithrix flava TaxID=2957203 RepID=UPI003D7C27C3|nr:hypothetical protein [Acidimicrobiia bacterium EGI L10123]
MPIRPRRLRCAALAAALVLTACSSGSAASTSRVPPPSAVDPASEPALDPASDPPTGPHEIALVADLGPLPDGSGRAVVETTWRTDGAGTVHLAIDTPAGIVEQHVGTADEHWWWLHPEVGRTVADAEWVRFDLDAVAAAGGELPDVVVEARQPPPQPDGIGPGDAVAGREVLAVEVVGDDEVHLTVAGIERPVLLRRRPLRPGTIVAVPSGSVDLRELPALLRW